MDLSNGDPVHGKTVFILKGTQDIPAIPQGRMSEPASHINRRTDQNSNTLSHLWFRFFPKHNPKMMVETRIGSTPEGKDNQIDVD